VGRVRAPAQLPADASVTVKLTAAELEVAAVYTTEAVEQPLAAIQAPSRPRLRPR